MSLTVSGFVDDVMCIVGLIKIYRPLFRQGRTVLGTQCGEWGFYCGKFDYRHSDDVTWRRFDQSAKHAL